MMIRESEIEMAKRGKRRKKREQRGRQEGGKQTHYVKLSSHCPHMHMGGEGGAGSEGNKRVVDRKRRSKTVKTLRTREMQSHVNHTYNQDVVC